MEISKLASFNSIHFVSLVIFIGFLCQTEGNPFPEAQQQTSSTWWYTGPSSIQRLYQYQQQQQQQHSQFQPRQIYHQHVNQMNPYYGGGIGSSGNCNMQTTPCSGHTRDSCTKYCNSIGFTFGSCQGSCCLCSQTSLDTNYITGGAQQHLQNQFLSMGQQTQQSQIKTETNILPNVETSLPQPHQEADLDVGESQHQPHKVVYTTFNNLQRQNNSKLLAAQWPTLSKYKTLTKPGKHGSEKKKPTYVEKPKNVTSPIKVCHTEACLKAAKRLEFNMNRKVDPCQNFYEYACGGFVKKTIIPPDETEVTTFTTLRNKVALQLRTLFEEPVSASEPKPFTLAKTLYKSCMDTDRLNTLGRKPLVKDVLDQIGGWPVLDPPTQPQHWSAELFTWSNYVVWFRELGISHDVFMKISVNPDIRNVKRRLLTIGEPHLGLSREVLIQGMSDPSVRAYYKYMVDTATLFGASKSSAEQDMLKVLNFEISLAKSFYRPEGSRASAYYVPTTIAEMETKNPTIPWLELFQRILPKSTANSITSGETVIISAPHYVDAFFNLIQTVETRTVANYAVWRMISASMSYLSEAAKKLQFDFTTATTGQKQSVPRWKECTDIVSLSMGNGVGAMYIRRHFHASAKAEAEQMVTNIHSAFLQILGEVEWMDSATKGKAREKALGMSINVGYPKQHKNDAAITELYSEYNFQSGDYFGNVRNLVLSANNAAFAQLKVPIQKNYWVMHGKNAAVNAFYMPLDNAIQFPAAILQNPFFDSKRPRYMNYGAIGWVAGHEVSHGFDDQGHQFDKDGNYANWWDPFTKKTYTTKTQCMISQYGQFTTSSGLKINGINSQGENIADNGGIKQAYRGYQSWVQKHGMESTLPGFEKMTPNQLFWISAASNWCSVHRPERLRSHILTGAHAPGEFRVKGTFANSKDFAKDFSCPSGSAMNPVNKCSVW